MTKARRVDMPARELARTSPLIAMAIRAPAACASATGGTLWASKWPRIAHAVMFQAWRNGGAALPGQSAAVLTKHMRKRHQISTFSRQAVAMRTMLHVPHASKSMPIVRESICLPLLCRHSCSRVGTRIVSSRQAGCRAPARKEEYRLRL